MSSLTLAFVGDLYASAPTIDRLGAEATDLDPVFRRLAPADLRFANLEAPLLDVGSPLFSTGVRLRMPTRMTSVLPRLGIDVVSVANNHMFDYGPGGVRSTLEHLRAAGVAAVGAGLDRAQARAPVVRNIKGQRVGFLAACDNEGGGATGRQPGVNLLSPARLLQSVRTVRGDVDCLVVSVHTGIEFCAAPEPFFHDLAHRLIDAGATLVIGHHPHVPQGIERHGGGLIAYSLGDFLFDLPRDPADMDTRTRALNRLHMMLTVEVAGGIVTKHDVDWFSRDERGAYHEDANAEFESLCAAVRDPGELWRRVRDNYRAAFKENVYYAPIHFCRAFERGGSGPLRRFLWWLATLRREPKRRLLAGGCRAWVGHVLDHLTPSRGPA